MRDKVILERCLEFNERYGASESTAKWYRISFSCKKKTNIKNGNMLDLGSL